MSNGTRGHIDKGEQIILESVGDFELVVASQQTYEPPATTVRQS